MSGPYRRVPADDSSSDANDERIIFQKRADSPSSGPTRTRAERISDKIHALVWIGVGFAVAYYTDFVRVLLSDDRVNRPVFNVAVVLLTINAVLMLYLVVYLPKVKGIHDSSAWDVYCPRVIPTMTALGVLCGMLLIRATWPVWGFLAPLILGVVFIGALFSLHFLPWF